MLISSEAYRKWEKSALKEVREQFEGLQVTEYPITVTLVFFTKDKIRRDLTNMAEGVMDVLVDAKVITDDSWKYVDGVQLCHGGIDKLNPRVEVWLDD